MKSAILLSLILGFIGFLPLLGGPRYEAALVAGLLGPSWVAIATAVGAHREAREVRLASRGDGVPRVLAGGRVVLRGANVALLHVMGVFVVALLHGVRVGFCEPGMGLSLLALGPGVGMVSAGIWGGLVGTHVALGPLNLGRGAGVFAALGGLGIPLASFLRGVERFYSTPAVFGYDPFVGYFSGPLYDTVNYDLGRLLEYRVGTFATWGALGCIVALCQLRFDGPHRVFRFVETTGERLVWLVIGGVLALTSVAHEAFGEELTFRSSSASIKKALGRMTQSGPCRVHFSSGVDSRVATRTAEECEGHLVQLERYFGLDAGGATTDQRSVDVFLFANTEEKRVLMGASDTYIAKPWRREIYLQPEGFPHQVLGHELAHVVAGRFGVGPFKIAGPLGGLLPDPGRIEGFAVAAAPREDSEGTVREWAAAMKELELLPPLENLFQLSFLQTSAARSYGAAGAFVDFIRRTHGPQVLRKWYGGAPLDETLGVTWEELQSQFHADLDAATVPPDVLEIARPRFSRPGVFERRCPHAVDRAVDETVSLCPTQQARARTAASRAISLDPTRVDLELYVARCGYYSGNAAGSRAELERLANNEARYEPGARRAAWDFAGNIAWQEGKAKEARAAYEAATKLTFGRDEKRQIEFKLWALGLEDTNAEASGLIANVMAPRPGEELEAGVSLAQLAKVGSHQDLGRYLLARQYERGGATAAAIKTLGEADIEKLPLPSLRKEAARLGLLLACQARMQGSKGDALAQALITYRKHTLSPAEEFEAARMSERCETVGLRKASPSPSLSK